MDFIGLAEYLEKLEGTSSRLEMTRILAELFDKAQAEEAKLIAYLSQGQLGPKYDNPQTGMAEKQVIKAIATRFEIQEERVNKTYKEIGDLGKTVESIKSVIQNSKFQINTKFEIRKVYEKLIEIANTTREGSQERKIQLLGNLLVGLDGRSAKYVVRIVLGKMRTGFSDMTILDALSWMAVGDKSLRKDIERIYNVRADLGEVVRQVKNQKSKIKNIKVDPEIGTPILVARGERAKTIEEIWKRNGVSAAEHKLDGLRIQAHIKNSKVKSQNSKIWLFSRGLEDVTNMYPDVVEGLKRQVHIDCILDGEMIAVDENGMYRPFQETVQRKRKYDILEMVDKVPLKYFVFDLLFADGKNFLDEPNNLRWEKLQEIIDTGGDQDVIRLIPRKVVRSTSEIGEFFNQAVKEGTEGIFVKKLTGKYASGSRDFNWIKYKKSYDETHVPDTVDAVVMGYDLGEGKRSGFGIGGFLVGVKSQSDDKYLTLAKIGTGLKDDEWKKLRIESGKLRIEKKPENYLVNKQMGCDVWLEPKIVVEIKYDEITSSPVHSSGYAMRFPRLVSFRDMRVEDIASVAEIVRLFKLQRGGGVSGK